MNKKLQVFSELIHRAELASKLGMQYSGERNLYDALGYPKELTYFDYYTQYDRQDIASAIIDKPVDKTWSGDVLILESKDPEDTALEKAWKELFRNLKLKSKFIALDKLTCIGQYAVLLLGTSDIRQKEDWKNPIVGGAGLKLIYVKPFAECYAKISTFETDPTNSRFGLPKIYDLTLLNNGGQLQQIIQVHHSRLLHIVNDPLHDEIYGTPVLKKVFNRLMDIEKLSGGSAEMFWRGARPGYSGKVDENYALSEVDETAMMDQMNEYEHNLRRFIINRGIDMKEMAGQVSDPTPHLEIQIQLISAQTGIPKRILVGSERGELSSSQDADAWFTLIQDRRDEFAAPVILYPFIDKLIELKILPAVGKEGYTIQWTDLFSKSDKDKAEVGRTRATALREYASQPMSQSIVPPKAFFEFFLGLNAEEIELISQIQKEEIDFEIPDEEIDNEEEIDEEETEIDIEE